jgi:hypothetical protein
MESKKILAAWEEKKGSDKTLILSLPSTKKEGEYLIGVSLYKDTIIIAHECQASKCKQNCWHVDAAYQAFLKWRWWEDSSDKKVVQMYKKMNLRPDWEQIPIPGEAICFGFSKEGKVHAS